MNDLVPSNNSKPNSGRIFIGAGTVFKGTVIAPQEAVVHGELEGNLSASHVVIGNQGVVSGSLEADTIEIHGKVSQNVVSRKFMHAYKSALIQGNVEYAEIEIERGAKIEGALKQSI
jgi:cytoskeletal protein CcmA (bactofilin family)